MRKVKAFDIVFILLFAAAVGGSVYALRASGTSRAPMVYIRSEAGEFVYAISEEGQYSFDGPLGQTVVEIRDGGAAVVSSPCANQICVQAGRLTAAGQWAACLPNAVVVYIE